MVGLLITGLMCQALSQFRDFPYVVSFVCITFMPTVCSCSSSIFTPADESQLLNFQGAFPRNSNY